MKIKRLSGLQVEKLEEEYKGLIELIKSLKNILENKDVLDNTIISEMEEIRDTHGDLRRTVILPDEGDLELEDMIKDEDVVITLTNSGYIKRMPEGTYKPQHRGGQGISAMNKKEDDFVTELFITSTLDTLLFFTDTGRVFRLRAYDVPNVGRNAKGMAIVNLLELEEGERIASVIPVSAVNEGDYLVLMTKDGAVKRTSFEEYKNIRKGGIIAMGLREGDIVIGGRQTDGSKDLMAVTKNGMCIRFAEDTVREMGRTAMGVMGIRLDEGDEVVSFVVAEDDKSLAIFSSKGYGKRTSMTAYKDQNRAGKGLITYKVKEKTGEVVSAKVLDDNDQVMMITENGIIIRLLAESINLMGRSTSGVKLMNIKESNIVAVAGYIGEE